MNITPQQLRKFFDCDFETGELTWRTRTSDMDARSQQRRLFNSRFAGRPAFTAKNSDGYLGGKLMGRSLKAHTVIWAMMNGEWPSGEIDHIDGNRTNNSIKNLRCVDKSTNQRNASLRLDNTSGVVGVSYNKQWGKWSARIQHGGKRIFLGWFETAEEAAIARRDAEMRYGYHPNHGRAA